MKLLATHAFNCIVLTVKFGRTSCEDIPPALSIYLNLQKIKLSEIVEDLKMVFDMPAGENMPVRCNGT